MDTDAIEIKYGLPKALPTIQNGNEKGRAAALTGQGT